MDVHERVKVKGEDDENLHCERPHHYASIIDYAPDFGSLLRFVVSLFGYHS